ncbi:MAG TPA: hypothetical protein VFV50_08740 [Bdellovibrionales bacterium]|nr:hypothetical protein [Bdellovibrionales bacterium]
MAAFAIFIFLAGAVVTVMASVHRANMRKRHRRDKLNKEFRPERNADGTVWGGAPDDLGVHGPRGFADTHASAGLDVDSSPDQPDSGSGSGDGSSGFDSGGDFGGGGGDGGGGD